jgi:hypothetical protein
MGKLTIFNRKLRRKCLKVPAEDFTVNQGSAKLQCRRNLVVELGGNRDLLTCKFFKNNKNGEAK